MFRFFPMLCAVYKLTREGPVISLLYKTLVARARTSMEFIAPMSNVISYTATQNTAKVSYKYGKMAPRGAINGTNWRHFSFDVAPFFC